MIFDSKVLKGYLAINLGVLVVVAYIILSGIGAKINMEFIMLDILMILLIGTGLFNSIVSLNILETLEEIEAETKKE